MFIVEQSCKRFVLVVELVSFLQACDACDTCVQSALGQKKCLCAICTWTNGFLKGDDEWFSKNRMDGKVIFLSLCNLHYPSLMVF